MDRAGIPDPIELNFWQRLLRLNAEASIFLVAPRWAWVLDLHFDELFRIPPSEAAERQGDDLRRNWVHRTPTAETPRWSSNREVLIQWTIDREISAVLSFGWHHICALQNFTRCESPTYEKSRPKTYFHQNKIFFRGQNWWGRSRKSGLQLLISYNSSFFFSTRPSCPTERQQVYCLQFVFSNTIFWKRVNSGGEVAMQSMASTSAIGGGW